MGRLLDRSGKLRGSLNIAQAHLLTYVIYREQKTEVEDDEMDFKNLVFANNPEMYREMFPEDFRPKDEDLDWLVPESEEEVGELLEELRAAGVVT